MPAVSRRSQRLLSLNNIECHTESRWMSQDSGPNPGFFISQTTYASQRSFTCYEACPSGSSPADVVAVFRNTRIMEGGQQDGGKPEDAHSPNITFLFKVISWRCFQSALFEILLFPFCVLQGCSVVLLRPSLPHAALDFTSQTIHQRQSPEYRTYIHEFCV